MSKGRRRAGGARGRGVGTGPGGRQEEVDRDGIPPEGEVTLAAGDVAPRGAQADGRHGGGGRAPRRLRFRGRRPRRPRSSSIGTRDNPVEQPLFDDNPRIESGLEPEKGRCASTTGRTTSTRGAQGLHRGVRGRGRGHHLLQLAGGDAEAEDRQDQLRRLLPHAGRAAEVRGRASCCSRSTTTTSPT